MTTKGDKLYLEIRKDSQLARVLERIAQNPTIRTEEVSKMWEQKARGGGTNELTPTRATFLLDVLADATEGVGYAYKPSKGLAVVKGVRESLKVDVNAKSAVNILDEKTKVVIAESPKVRPEPVNMNVEVSATLTPAGDKAEGEVEIIFPEAPALPQSMPAFIEPEWYKAMEVSLDAGKHCAIAGPPGIGKSTAPEQYFIRRGQPFVTLNCDAGLRRRDLVGTPEIAGGTSRFVCAEYAAAAIFGWGVIINEVNAADADALLFMNGQLETPFTVNIHGRSYPVHKNFKLVVTYNPGLIGTKPLPQAFKDRFFPAKLGFPEAKLLKKILLAKGMPKGAAYEEKLLEFATACFNHYNQRAIRYQLSPRRLYDTVFLLENGVTKSLNTALKLAVCSAIDTDLDSQAVEKIVDQFAADGEAKADGEEADAD
jgi:hypothetical protein